MGKVGPFRKEVKRYNRALRDCSSSYIKGLQPFPEASAVKLFPCNLYRTSTKGFGK